jgi:hypothetical protein
MQHFLRQVENNAKHYHFPDQGTSAASVEELAFLLDQMSDAEAAQHMHEEGNHFAPWVEEVIGDEELAVDLAPLTQRAEVVKALQHRVFMINALFTGVAPLPEDPPAGPAPSKRPTTKQILRKPKKQAARKRARLSPPQPNRAKPLKKQVDASLNSYKQELITRLMKEADPALKKRIRAFQQKNK